MLSVVDGRNELKAKSKEQENLYFTRFGQLIPTSSKLAIYFFKP